LGDGLDTSDADQVPTTGEQILFFRSPFAPLRLGGFAVNIEFALLAMVANTLIYRRGAKTQRRKVGI